MSNYPTAALALRLEGRASITCVVTVTGALNECSVATESPPELGFGPAALRMATTFHMRPMTVDGGPVSGAMVLIPDPMGATVRKITKDGLSRIVVRTRFTYDPSLKVSEKRVAGIASEQRRSFDARFPGLERVPMEYSWAGALCLSRNHVPAFGEVEEGLFSACCENGLGTVKSTLAGMMAADLATGAASPELDTYKNQPEPARLPPEPIAWLGVNSVIRLQELRAGREG